MHVALQQGQCHQAPPRQGTGAWHSDAVGFIQHPESSTSIKDTFGPAGLHILLMFVGNPGLGQALPVVGGGSDLPCWIAVLGRFALLAISMRNFGLGLAGRLKLRMTELLGNLQGCSSYVALVWEES